MRHAWLFGTGMYMNGRLLRLTGTGRVFRRCSFFEMLRDLLFLLLLRDLLLLLLLRDLICGDQNPLLVFVRSPPIVPAFA